MKKKIYKQNAGGIELEILYDHHKVDLITIQAY